MAHRLREQGRDPRLLKLPTIKLYGKDRKAGGKQLTNTAQTNVTTEADGKSVHVPVFV